MYKWYSDILVPVYRPAYCNYEQSLFSFSSVLLWKVNYMCCGTMGTLKRQFTSAWQRSEVASWRKVLSKLNLEG